MAGGEPWGFASTSTSLSDIYYQWYGQLAQQQNANQQQNVYQQLLTNGIVYGGVPPAPASDPGLERTCDHHMGPCSKIHPLKKLKTAIDKLRAEISAWHGDVLERCPA